MVNRKHDHDHDHDPRNDHANDNSEHQREDKAIAAAPAASAQALTSLTALGAVLNNVNTASVAGRTGLPMLLFKREGDGTWSFGQKKIVVEDGSRWAVNPLSFTYGYVCFNNNKRLGEHMVSVSQPKPNAAELPNLGFPWQEQWCVNLKCLSGADAGVEVTFKGSTDGGLKWVAGLVDATRDRLNGDQHDGKMSAVVVFGKDSYQHSQYGRVWTPLFDIVDWLPLSGPAPTPTPSPPPLPAEQPRRRRVS